MERIILGERRLLSKSPSLQGYCVCSEIGLFGVVCLADDLACLLALLSLLSAFVPRTMLKPEARASFAPCQPLEVSDHSRSLCGIW